MRSLLFLNTSSAYFSKLFAREEGGKGGYPKDHTLVCDLGNRVLSRKEQRKIEKLVANSNLLHIRHITT